MVGGWENKGNLGRMKQTPLREFELILRMLKWSDPLEEKHAGRKRINMTTSMIKKDKYSHSNMRTPFMKGMDSTFGLKQVKQNKGLSLQNKPKQTYDRDFVRSFRGGAHTGSII